MWNIIASKGRLDRGSLTHTQSPEKEKFFTPGIKRDRLDSNDGEFSKTIQVELQVEKSFRITSQRRLQSGKKRRKID